MRLNTLLALAACGAVSFAAAARGHDGPRVWVSAVDGRLITETSDDDYDPSVYAPARVFTGELPQYFGTYTTQFPGYEAPRDGSGGVADGTYVGFKLAGPLLTLSADAARLVPTTTRYAGQPATPQLAITFPDVPPAQAPAYTRYTSTGVVTGYDFTNTIAEHTHLAYTFLGNGASSAAAGPDGVYVLPMVLTSPSLAMSKWYFLTFKKNATDAALAQAAGIAQVMADARPGDTNFDGAVDFADLLTVAQHYGAASGTWWADGDFNVDGAVAFDDLLALAQTYGSTALGGDAAGLAAAAGVGATFRADWALARSLVPEPGTSAAAALTLAVRSRRKRRPARA